MDGHEIFMQDKCMTIRITGQYKSFDEPGNLLGQFSTSGSLTRVLTAKMASFVLSIVLAALAVTSILGSPSDPVPQPDQSWLDRHDSFVQNTAASNGSIPILFLGASIVDGFDNEGKAIWDSKYASIGAVNYGIGGDRIEHVLWRVLNGEVAGLSPQLVAVHIGGNNISGGSDSDEEIVAGILKLVATLRELLPSTKILLFGIFPRRLADTYTRVANINIQISKVENGDSVRFLNMMDQFSLGWGQINPELYQEDSLHFVTAGYVMWDKTMEGLFQEMITQLK